MAVYIAGPFSLSTPHYDKIDIFYECHFAGLASPVLNHNYTTSPEQESRASRVAASVGKRPGKTGA
jgi:hypothetical protein